MIFTFAGGLGLFLFGIRLMSNGLRDAAGTRLRSFLQSVTKAPIIGLAVGTVVTGLIQSSSATTTMVVGLANAGLLNLRQAISVVLGANIGTTVTAWIVAFVGKVDVVSFALPMAGFGFFLSELAKRRRTKLWGQIILGLGLLFVGLLFMKDSVAPLQGSEKLSSILAVYGRYPLLGLLTGAVMTILLQSSSATIGMLQVLSMNNVIPFATAIPIVLGDNIGTTTTALFASIGTGPVARRTARAHMLFNLFGVMYVMPLAWTFSVDGGTTSIYARFIEWLFPGPLTQANVAWHIALCHSVFNVANAAIFTPAIGLLVWAATKITPVSAAEKELLPRYLDPRLISTPDLALEQATREIVRMLRLAQGAVRDAMRAFMQSDERTLERVGRAEEAVDGLQHDITQYLVQTSEVGLSPAEAESMPVLVHTVNDIERIGDHSENLGELAMRRIEQRLPFTQSAESELNMMYDEVDKMIDEVAGALETADRSLAKKALKREERLNQLQVDLRRSHVQRLSEGECQLLSGLVFIDIVDNLEKIGDHLSNIAQAILGGLRWDGQRSMD